MTTYNQGVPALSDPAASSYFLGHTLLRFPVFPNTHATLVLPVYRWNGTSWVRQN